MELPLWLFLMELPLLKKLRALRLGVVVLVMLFVMLLLIMVLLAMVRLLVMVMRVRSSEIPLLHPHGLEIMAAFLLNVVAMLSVNLVQARLAALVVVLAVEVILRALLVTDGVVHLIERMAILAMTVLEKRASILSVLAAISKTLVDLPVRAMLARMT